MLHDLAPSPPLIYAGTEIHQRHEMLSLTDMWRAAGSDEARRPANWTRKEGATFIAYLTDILNVPQGHIIVGERGRNGATFAHWQIGLSYAQYLSPEFHLWCNTVVRERMEGRTSITLRDLDQHVRQVLGGIVKAVVAKALEDRLEPVERAVIALDERIRQIAAPSGRYKTSEEYVPALTVIDNAGVPQKGRGGLVRRASNALDRFCRRQGKMVRSEAHTERRLFHVEAVSEWLQAEGREIIRRHMDRLAGQTVMQFPRRHHRARPEVVA